MPRPGCWYPAFVTMKRSAKKAALVSAGSFEKILRSIEAGVEEGATLVAGWPGKPEGHDRRYQVRPTVFRNVRPT